MKSWIPQAAAAIITTGIHAVWSYSTLNATHPDHVAASYGPAAALIAMTAVGIIARRAERLTRPRRKSHGEI